MYIFMHWCLHKKVLCLSCHERNCLISKDASPMRNFEIVICSMTFKL